MDYRNSFSKRNCRSISVSCSCNLMTNGGINFSKSTGSTCFGFGPREILSEYKRDISIMLITLHAGNSAEVFLVCILGAV